eukprot:TRINITY_DN1527_c1_g1_i1.p1 TRINITY_DN1527_c1_g1~~TRINITY_DN1527_c1_g1_i1.p1  ORF type:complete len:365 (+),score=74.29 TRINITY_DN1527_c1_g1_i1:3-1097(+)
MAHKQNRATKEAYELIMEKVIERSTPKLQEAGFSQSVLLDLKQRWMKRLVESGVLDLAGSAPVPDGPLAPQPELRKRRSQRASGAEQSAAPVPAVQTLLASANAAAAQAAAASAAAERLGMETLAAQTVPTQFLGRPSVYPPLRFQFQQPQQQQPPQLDGPWDVDEQRPPKRARLMSQMDGDDGSDDDDFDEPVALAADPSPAPSEAPSGPAPASGAVATAAVAAAKAAPIAASSAAAATAATVSSSAAKPPKPAATNQPQAPLFKIDDGGQMGANMPPMTVTAPSGLMKRHPLRGDEDLDPLSDGEPEKQIETRNFILCQFEKVRRGKAASGHDNWSMAMRNGIVQLNGAEFVFARATGSFLW